MHPEARNAVRSMIKEMGVFDLYAPPRILDLGGRDINGGIRDLFPDDSIWMGVDIEPGPGVDLVRDCTRPWPDMNDLFNVVVCTEVLEHVEKWRDLVRTCSQALAPNGILLLTCASEGRRPHGASGAMWPADGEWYQNVSPEDLAEHLGDLFRYSAVRYNPNPGDAYAWAYAPKAKHEKPEMRRLTASERRLARDPDAWTTAPLPHYSDPEAGWS